MKRYQHQSISNGQITHGDEQFAIRDGIVELPEYVDPSAHGFAPAVESASEVDAADETSLSVEVATEMRPKGRRR